MIRFYIIVAALSALALGMMITADKAARNIHFVISGDAQ